MQVTLLYLHTYHDALWNSTVDLQLKAFLFLLARAITRAGFISNVQVCLAWWKVHGFTMLNNRSSKGFVKFRPRFVYCRPCTPLKSGPKLPILQFPSAKVVDLRFPLFLATFLYVSGKSFGDFPTFTHILFGVSRFWHLCCSVSCKST
jgi:hypothetical protein